MSEQQSSPKPSKKKKSVILLLILIIILPLIAFGIFKSQDNNSVIDYSPTFSVSNATTTLGSEVYVSVAVENNPGIAGFVIDLEYDKENLKPLEIVQGDIVNQGMFISNVDPTINEGLLKATWFDVTDMTENGDLYAIKFRVLSKDGGITTPITIRYDDGNVANQSLENVDFKIRNSIVAINN